MHERARHKLTSALVGALALVWSVASATAAPDQIDQELRNKLRAFDTRLTQDMPAPGIDARTLIHEAGLGDVTGAAAPTRAVIATTPFNTEPRPIEADLMDVRLALGLIAQIYGGKDNFDLVYAMTSEDTNVLVINSGDVTVADLFQLLGQKGLQADGGNGRNLLRVPVIIWQGARLRMTPGEELILSRSDGAALLNFGALDIDGGTIRSEGEASTGAPDYIPVVVNAGGASVKVRNAHFQGLGFGSEAKFSGFSVVRNPLLVRKDEILIENSTFDDVMSLSVSMADNAVIRNNRIHDARGASIVVTHSLNARIAGNLITGAAPTNAIRVLQGSAGAMVAGNVIMDGEFAGIAVRNDSHRITIRDNVVWNRGGGGISVSNITCGLIQKNLVIDNRQKGIEVRTGRQMTVRDNLIIGNKSAGIWVSAQDSGVPTLIVDNLLMGNSSGLASATGERLAIQGNDFTRQFPRFVAGDLTAQARLIANDLTGSTPLVLTAGGADTGPLPDVSCDNRGEQG